MAGTVLAGFYRPGSGLTRVLSALAAGLPGPVSLLGFEPGRSTAGLGTLDGRSVTLLPQPSRYFIAPQPWLSGYLEERRPDCVLVSGPGFMAAPLLEQMRACRPETRLALYLPVEGRLRGESLAGVLGGLDACFLYTQHALEGVRRVCARAALADPGFRTPRMAAVGHGFDADCFAPFASMSRKAARRAMFGDAMDDAFIVLNCNRADPRKRLDLTIEGFALFARGKADVRLCLHCIGRGPRDEVWLRGKIADEGMEDRILLSPDPADARLPDGRLGLLYTACDVGLTTSGGEGFGLGVFEHASTGAAQIVPGHTSFRENWSGAAMLVEPIGSKFNFHESCDMYAVAPAGVAEALERLYRDPDCRSAMAAAAMRRTRRAAYRWPTVARKIGTALEAMVSGRAQSPDGQPEDRSPDAAPPLACITPDATASPPPR